MSEMNNGFDPNLVIYTPDQTEAIEDHITEHFGDFPKVFRDNSPKDVKVDIAVIPPDDDRYFLTLVTMGLGAYRMRMPKELRGQQLDRAELVLCLPANWNFDPQDILCRKVVLKSAFDANGNIADYSNVQSETVSDGINDVKVAAQLPDTLPEGKYAVYLRISQYGNWPADSNYSVVRFANDSAYYDKETGANYVGSFVLNKKAPVVTAIPASRIAKGGRTIRLENHGQTLTVQNARRVEIFDLTGHRLMAQDLQGTTTISLKNLPRTSLIIRTR